MNGQILIISKPLITMKILAFIPIISLYLLGCNYQKKILNAIPKKMIVTYSIHKNNGTIVKMNGLKRKYYIPKIYNIGDTIEIFFIKKLN